MTSADDWLPALLEFAAFGGSWDDYLAAIYEAFCKDFVETSSWLFDGKRVALKRHPLLLDKEATFWHFVSSGPVEQNRMPDLRRCERIRWPKAMMTSIDGGRLKCWQDDRGGEPRYVLALEDFSYAVVVADRANYVLPWTAYLIEHENRRRRMEEEYEANRLKGWCRP